MIIVIITGYILHASWEYRVNEKNKTKRMLEKIGCIHVTFSPTDIETVVLI